MNRFEGEVSMVENRFEALLESVGSGFHDGTLEKLVVDLAGASLVLNLRFSKSTPEQEDDQEYLGQLCFDNVKDIDLLSHGRTFPEFSLLDGIDAKATNDGNGTAFTVSGIYGWAIHFLATDFSYSEQRVGGKEPN